MSSDAVSSLDSLSFSDDVPAKSILFGDDQFFEGVEKLLEILFSSETKDAKSLRVIPREELAAALHLAECRILHSVSNECMDSYVLSESSMFVSDSRIILKTCGTTRLLLTVGRLLELAQRFCNLDVVNSVFYSRKNFMCPEMQLPPHRSFELEIDYLDSYFNDGSAYCMGSLRHDRWFLYTMTAPQMTLSYADHTLEILMTDMPIDVLRVFTQAVSKDAKDCTKRSGIYRVVPFGTIVHEELFSPCGYSMNGILPHTDQYITIHVTPQPDFSYVSFETNQNSVCLYTQCLKVIDVFKPNKFMVTLFASDSSVNGKEAQQNLFDRDIAGFRRTNLQFLRLEHDTLVYAQFVRRKSTGTKNVPLKRIIDNDDRCSE